MSVEVFAIVSVALTVIAGGATVFVLRTHRDTQTPGRVLLLVLALILVPPVGLLAVVVIVGWRQIRRMNLGGKRRVRSIPGEGRVAPLSMGVGDQRSNPRASLPGE